MGEPFCSEIRMMGFDYAPRGWAQCDGALLPISQNQTLYSLLGDAFGGDGRNSFALPDMRDRVPVGTGYQYQRGWKGGGGGQVTIDGNTMPQHTHEMNALTTIATKNNAGTAGDSLFATEDNMEFYAAPSDLVNLNPEMVTAAGEGQSHANVQPSQVVNFCIAISGVYPPRNW